VVLRKKISWTTEDAKETHSHKSKEQGHATRPQRIGKSVKARGRLNGQG